MASHEIALRIYAAANGSSSLLEQIFCGVGAGCRRQHARERNDGDSKARAKCTRAQGRPCETDAMTCCSPCFPH